MFTVGYCIDDEIIITPDATCPDCGNKVSECTCEKCPECGNKISECTCEKCPDCGNKVSKCTCEKCSECGNKVSECTCEKCPDCGNKVSKCTCEKCSECGNKISECICEKCPDCGNKISECICEKCPDCGNKVSECTCPKCPDCEHKVSECTCKKCPDCGNKVSKCTCEKCQVCGNKVSECICDDIDIYIINDFQKYILGSGSSTSFTNEIITEEAPVIYLNPARFKYKAQLTSISPDVLKDKNWTLNDLANRLQLRSTITLKSEYATSNPNEAITLKASNTNYNITYENEAIWLETTFETPLWKSDGGHVFYANFYFGYNTSTFTLLSNVRISISPDIKFSKNDTILKLPPNNSNQIMTGTNGYRESNTGVISLKYPKSSNISISTDTASLSVKILKLDGPDEDNLQYVEDYIMPEVTLKSVTRWYDTNTILLSGIIDYKPVEGGQDASGNLYITVFYGSDGFNSFEMKHPYPY